VGARSCTVREDHSRRDRGLAELSAAFSASTCRYRAKPVSSRNLAAATRVPLSARRFGTVRCRQIPPGRGTWTAQDGEGLLMTRPAICELVVENTVGQIRSKGSQADIPVSAMGPRPLLGTRTKGEAERLVVRAASCWMGGPWAERSARRRGHRSGSPGHGRSGHRHQAALRCRARAVSGSKRPPSRRAPRCRSCSTAWPIASRRRTALRALFRAERHAER
jgi:hypothetical protein